jgi:hypothetical protein
MADLGHLKPCGGALLTTHGMPMFAIRYNRKYHVAMQIHVWQFQVAMQTWTYVLINFPEVYIGP